MAILTLMMRLHTAKAAISLAMHWAQMWSLAED